MKLFFFWYRTLISNLKCSAPLRPSLTGVLYECAPVWVERLVLTPEGDRDLWAARGHHQGFSDGPAVKRQHPAALGDPQKVRTRLSALTNACKQRRQHRSSALWSDKLLFLWQRTSQIKQ